MTHDAQPPHGTEVEAIVERILEQRARQTRRRLGAIGVVGAVGLATVLWGGPALAQAMCSQTLPPGFVTLCPNTPATAADLNVNFLQGITYLTQKVGAVGTPNINTSGALNVSGASTLQSSLTVNGASNFQGTSVSTLYSSGAATINGNGNVNGSLTVIGVGGNVPHGCAIRAGPANSYQANCLGNEVAVGGGGRCMSLYRLTESLPWGGPGDGDSPTPGQEAHSWRSVCQVWGNATTYAYPQLGTYVICCQR